MVSSTNAVVILTHNACYFRNNMTKDENIMMWMYNNISSLPLLVACVMECGDDVILLSYILEPPPVKAAAAPPFLLLF